jgi:hypothetical protein
MAAVPSLDYGDLGWIKISDYPFWPIRVRFQFFSSRFSWVRAAVKPNTFGFGFLGFFLDSTTCAFLVFGAAEIFLSSSQIGPIHLWDLFSRFGIGH